jgi:hypothetical protein
MKISATRPRARSASSPAPGHFQPRGFAAPARRIARRMSPSPHPGTETLLLQRKLSSAETFSSNLEKSETQREDLLQIVLALEAYNEIEPQADQDLQQRLGALAHLDRAIYTWFDHHKTADLDKVPNALYLQDLLQETSREHQELIDQAARQNLLPVNVANLKKKEIEKVRFVWESLLSGQGNLKILEKETGFGLRTLSSIAKLLEGSTGRDLLADLSEDRGSAAQNIVISSQFEDELKGTPVEERPESEAIPINTLDSSTENAHKLTGSSADAHRTDLPTYDKTGSNFSPEEFHDFLLATEESPKLKWGDSAYKRGTGTGSLVRILSEPGYLLGQDESQILMPDFVTLGHELGHAQRLLRGAPLQTENIESLGVTDRADQKLWNNPEEYVNIRAVENRIRNEHGLSPRKYHAGDRQTLTFERNRATYLDAYESWYGALPMYKRKLMTFHSLGSQLIETTVIKPNYADPSVLQDLLRDLVLIQRPSSNDALLWQGILERIKSDGSEQRRLLNVLPSIISEDSSLRLPDWVIRLALHFGRESKKWNVLRLLLQSGYQAQPFEQGLTHEELEEEIDPEGEIDVETEYVVNPDARWWRQSRRIYVRKRFHREKED